MKKIFDRIEARLSALATDANRNAMAAHITHKDAWNDVANSYGNALRIVREERPKDL